MATRFSILKFAQVLFDQNWERDRWTAQPSHVVRYIAKKAGAKIQIGRILPPNDLVDVTFTCALNDEAWVVDDVIHVRFERDRPPVDGPPAISVRTSVDRPAKSRRRK